jgi:hypothetical protein
MLKIVAVVALAASGCGGKSNPGPPAADAIKCTIDESCSPPPCGPCESGSVLTSSMYGQECVVNPCKRPAAVCSPTAHVCVAK